MFRAAFGPRPMTTLPPRFRWASSRAASFPPTVGKSHRNTTSTGASGRNRSPRPASWNSRGVSTRTLAGLSGDRSPSGNGFRARARNPLARSSGSGDGLPFTTMTGIVSRTVTASDRVSSSRRTSSPARTWRTYCAGSRKRFCLSSGKVTVTDALAGTSTSF